jgi:serine/threonine-protein kinase HipA
MESEIFVYVDLNETPYLMGRLWACIRKDRESATFEYDKGWLAYPEARTRVRP